MAKKKKSPGMTVHESSQGFSRKTVIGPGNILREVLTVPRLGRQVEYTTKGGKKVTIEYPSRLAVVETPKGTAFFQASRFQSRGGRKKKKGVVVEHLAAFTPGKTWDEIHASGGGRVGRGAGTRVVSTLLRETPTRGGRKITGRQEVFEHTGVHDESYAGFLHLDDPERWKKVGTRPINAKKPKRTR